jgi:hypothetical protein
MEPGMDLIIREEPIALIAEHVETQTINVPACRFYSKMGCTLGAIDRYAYVDLPNEIQLLWFKELGPADHTGPAFEDQLVH